MKTNKTEVVIFDIEASCDDKNINPYYNMETIEIGAVKVKDGEITDTFQTFIEPEYVDTLTPFCTKLTGITMDDLRGAPIFNKAILEFYSFIYGLPIYSCGEFDRKFLTRELREKGNKYSHKLAMNAIKSSHKNLKIHFDNITGKGMKGMVKMARILNIELTGTHHRALDDSINLAKIYIKLESIRENRLKEEFNGSKLENLVDNINQIHKRRFNVKEGSKIQSDMKNEMFNLVHFLDSWRNVIIIDHDERKLRYISDKDLNTIKRFTKY